MGNNEIKENDKSYHPLETIKLDYCTAVLSVVLKNHPKANDLYENIKDYMLLAGVQETFKILERKIPGSDELIKGIVTKAGYNKQSKPDKNSSIAARKLIKGTMKLIIGLKNRLYIWIVINNRRRRDLKVLARGVDTFIRVCFNRESDRAKGVCRVTGNSSTMLTNLVVVRAILETNEKYHRIFNRMGHLPMFKQGKKVFAIITDIDREQALEVGLVYPMNCAKNKWLDEVKVILFGPSEKLAAFDTQVQTRIKEMKGYGIEVLACKWCSDRMGVTSQLEAQGITVVYVGPIISQLIKDGWAQ